MECDFRRAEYPRDVLSDGVVSCCAPGTTGGTVPAACRVLVTKSAQRLAYHVLGMTDEGGQNVFRCHFGSPQPRSTIARVCCNLTDQELCPVCRSESQRPFGDLCGGGPDETCLPWNAPTNITALYHVLHGAISPLIRRGAGTAVYQRIAGPDERRGGKGSHYGHQPHRGRGGNGYVPVPPAQTHWACWSLGWPTGFR